MILEDFLRHAEKNHLCCGNHYAILSDGTVEEFVIFANAYHGVKYIYKPDNTEEYQNLKLLAAKSPSTLFQSKESI